MNYLKKWYRFFVTSYENRCLNKYYLSIKVLPVMNWIELYETNDLIHLSRTGKICKRAPAVLDIIKDELMDKFGTSPEFMRQHELRVELELLQCEKIHTGDISVQFHIEMAEAELKKIIAIPDRKIDMPGIVTWLKRNGINIDPKHDTAYWLYKHLEDLTAEIANKNGRK